MRFTRERASAKIGSARVAATMLPSITHDERERALLKNQITAWMHHAQLVGTDRDVLATNQGYYNEAGTHLSLNKDAPVSRAIQFVMLGRLHHQYNGNALS